MLGQGFDSPLIHYTAKYRTILKPLASRFFQFNVRYIWDKGEPAIMLDFLIRHQTDVMLSLSCVCAMTAFLVFLTGSLEKSRKAALMIMEIGGMILLIGNIFGRYYYVIDEQNTYHRSWGFMVCYIIPLITLVIILTVLMRDCRNFRRCRITSWPAWS